ncbi:MAG: response regulator [Desulfobacteraceae bacterium]|nr:response regulator [Desulfobacteraceae bacterium]
MESVGRLAGGVAHDFNNKLSVIMGYCELAMEKTIKGTELYSEIDEIYKAAVNSAEITRQLLAFARKQTINPKVINLNKTVENMLKMLGRLIGEEIDLVWAPADLIWMVKVDTSQVDQVMANLCVNARDAMKGSGKIIIETRNTVFNESYCSHHSGFVPGKYVMIAVSDQGCGMDEKTLENIFEPFFTTKASGKGTGLGLATVYGIVKQNRGFINVYSETGNGSVFKVYFPCHENGEEDTGLLPDPEEFMAKGESVLVVDDDIPILQITCKILENLGYKTMKASSSAKALELVCSNSGKIDLLLTDVIMPETNGLELARRAESFHPGIKVLFMSGYTANTIAIHGVLKKGMNFIEKPFSISGLGKKIRKVLNG